MVKEYKRCAECNCEHGDGDCNWIAPAKPRSMSKSLRLDIRTPDGAYSMTGITVTFEDNETDFEMARAKALGYFVQELSRYGLHEALGGIGIRPLEPHVMVDGGRWKPETKYEATMVDLEKSIYGTATLGAVIAALERAEPDADVQYDFCYTRPTTVKSYRGYYDHLALGWSEESVKDKDGKFVSHWSKAKDVLAELKSALGKTFEGYKGGNYTMRADTPLWVAKWGESGGTGIVGMTREEHTVMFMTAHVD